MRTVRVGQVTVRGYSITITDRPLHRLLARTRTQIC